MVRVRSAGWWSAGRRLPAAAKATLFLPLAALGSSACAHVSAPPGGPPDSIPPALIAVVPDSYSVVPGFEDRVVFQFDEAISERNLQGAVVLYPFERRPMIDKGKAELRVRSRNGWTADRIYHLRVEPVVQDLFGNRIEAPIQYVFSTGAELTSNLVQGQVFDRITGDVLRQGRVDLVRMPDTLRYGTIADSIGNFGIRVLPTGDFFAIGYEDSNNNGRADDFDRADSARVSLGAADTITLEFQVFRHDTLGPRLATATPTDSIVVELEFDSYIDPDFELAASMVSLLALPDSSAIPVDTVLHAWQYTSWRDSVAAVQRAIRDSLAAERAAAADTAGAPPDTGARIPPDTAGAPEDTGALRAPDAANASGDAEARTPPETARPTLLDTADQRPQRVDPRPGPPAPPLPQQRGAPAQSQEEPEEPRPLPDRRIYVVAASPIPPGEVLVIVRGLRNLTGLVGDSEVTYEQPAPPEAAEEPPSEEEPSSEEGPPPEPAFPTARSTASARRRHVGMRLFP